MVLDGEAQPAGGWAYAVRPRTRFTTAAGAADHRPARRRLAGHLVAADAVVSHPIDPIALAHELAGLMRERPAVTS